MTFFVADHFANIITGVIMVPMVCYGLYMGLCRWDEEPPLPQHTDPVYHDKWEEVQLQEKALEESTPPEQVSPLQGDY